MTRFDLDMDGSMEPSEHGRWVRYEDVQAREWVGLTDEDLLRCLGPEACRIPFGWYKLARAIEAMLKEKNCG